MLQIRKVYGDEFAEAVKLADATFRSGRDLSMGTTFPMVFFSGYQQSYGAFLDGRLVCFIGLVPNVVWIGSAALRVYSIGAVCTHPDFRGKGYAGQVLKNIREHMGKAKSPLLLVSGDGKLYTGIGCAKFGSFTRCSISTKTASELQASMTNYKENLAIREMEAEDWFDIRHLAQAREVRFEQGLWDLATLIAADVPAGNSNLTNRVLVAVDRKDGQLVGFLVAAYPPADHLDCDIALKATAIEWAGSTEAVKALLAEAVLKYPATELQLHAAWQETELLEQLSAIKLGLESSEGLEIEFGREPNLGTVLITDPELLIEQLRSYLAARDKHINDSLNVRIMPEGIKVSVKEQSCILERNAFTALIFNGECPSDMDIVLKEALQSLFPIPFPYVGGINYV